MRKRRYSIVERNRTCRLNTVCVTARSLKDPTMTRFALPPTFTELDHVSDVQRIEFQARNIRSQYLWTLARTGLRAIGRLTLRLVHGAPRAQHG